MAGRSLRAGAQDSADIPPTAVTTNKTFFGFPESPPATLTYPGGARRSSSHIAIVCISGVLGVSVQPDGSGEIQLGAGESLERDIRTQGLILRGIGAGASFQASIELE